MANWNLSLLFVQLGRRYTVGPERGTLGTDGRSTDGDNT
jgi:hypothetical protein